MKVSGFSFIKNAVKYDYPIVASIKSVLPICDEFVIAVGDCDDDTIGLINSIGSDKIKIINTVWDESDRKGGVVFAKETNIAFSHIAADSDWAFYIQGDEVINEKYLDTVYKNMERYKDNPKVDGLLFKYHHFFGSYDYIGISSNWYPFEIRVVKNNKSIYSYRDAQGFRKEDNEKLNVIPIDAYINHYGWVRKPDAMQQKQVNFRRLQRGNDWKEDENTVFESFSYDSHIGALKKFSDNHPQCMQERINSKNWKFSYDISYSKLPFKDKMKRFLRKYLGIHLGYKNYKIVKG